MTRRGPEYHRRSEQRIDDRRYGSASEHYDDTGKQQPDDDGQQPPFSRVAQETNHLAQDAALGSLRLARDFVGLVGFRMSLVVH